MNLKIITAPITEPVSLAEAKLHLRVTTDTDNTLITSLISSARQHCENITCRALASATFELVMDTFPEKIVLPMSPVESVTSKKYTDSDGIDTTLAATEYILYTSEPAVVIPDYDVSWPSFTEYPLGAVKVRYVAGYRAASTDASLHIPEAIKQAILLIISTLYENRENIVIGQTIANIPMGAEALLQPFRIWSF
jgi:uncharacterized phiE125 gp8 family phage protein